LAENGTAAIVLPHGVLFRSGSERVIRKYIIKELNYLDAVIGLPPNLFYGTSIPACVLIFKKCRVNDDNILFIDASGDDEYVKVGNQNALTDEHVEKIVDTYSRRLPVERYASVAKIVDVAQHDYNLNIPRYVDTFIASEQVNLIKVSQKLHQINDQIELSNKAIRSFCDELDIPSPF